MNNKEHTTLQMDNVPSAQSANRNQENLQNNTSDSGKQRIPRAVPEKDDDEFDERPLVKSAAANPGVDDGLLGSTDAIGARPNGRRPSYAFPGYNGPGVVMYNGVETPIPDVNAYQHKKTLAQGMMDLALLSANANQLRYVMDTSQRHPYYYPSLIFISLSILFQIAVGVGLIWNGRYNIKDERDICRANKINNYTVIGIFVVTVINVLISAFGVADSPIPTSSLSSIPLSPTGA